MYEVARQAGDMSDKHRLPIRQDKATPSLKTRHACMLSQRDGVPMLQQRPKPSMTVLSWVALTRCLEGWAVPIDKAIRHRA